MNYRHAFHAGNFADCFKHALLVGLLDAMARKPAPFFVLDTHAGAGRYDLDAEPAQRTGEAEGGIRRLLSVQTPVLHRYLDLVQTLGLYPGSPALIRALLRADDRLACCERLPEEAAALRRLFRGDPRTEVHERSAWEALGALLPPKQKRGLVLIDPPFEARDEFTLLADGLLKGYRRFSHGVFAAWYPIKQLAAVRAFLADIGGRPIRDVFTVELLLREPFDASRLNGCGLLVINPPFGFEAEARAIAAAVLAGVGDNEAGAGSAVTRITDE